MRPKQFGVLFRNTLGDHGDDLDVRIIQRFHPTLHGAISTDVDKAGIDGGMILRRFGDRLVDGDRNQPAAVRHFIGLAGIGRIDERLDREGAFN